MTKFAYFQREFLPVVMFTVEDAFLPVFLIGITNGYNDDLIL